jgi:hypothetical protein
MYAVNCPCGNRLIVLPSPVGKWFTVAFFGKRLVVILLIEHGLLGILTVLALGAVHTVFCILTVLAFGNIHAFGNKHAISSILAVFTLGVFATLVVV